MTDADELCDLVEDVNAICAEKDIDLVMSALIQMVANGICIVALSHKADHQAAKIEEGLDLLRAQTKQWVGELLTERQRTHPVN